MTTATSPPLPAAVETPADSMAQVRQKPHIAHFLTIRVPASWARRSWRAAPPSASPLLPSNIAAATATMLNAERLAKGQFRSWTICVPGWRFLSVEVNPGWTPGCPADLPPAVVAIETDRAIDVHRRLVSLCEPGFHVLRVMSLADHCDHCTPDPTLRPSFGPDPHRRTYHVALVHPLYGTLATSPGKWPQEDADKILAEATPALIVPEVASHS